MPAPVMPWPGSPPLSLSLIYPGRHRGSGRYKSFTSASPARMFDIS